ncbi:MAG: hypothetical protein H7223_06660 [Pedobacter sp.]|nr:hypothetical protein [Pedobacter sp.]
MNLINGLRAKDKEAFKAVYTLYSPALFGIISTIIPDSKLAAEALEDTFSTIWHQFSSCSKDYKLLFTSLSIVARNTAIKHLNTKKTLVNKKDEDKTELPEVLDLIYAKGVSESEAAAILNIPLEGVRIGLRNQILKLRIHSRC